MGFWDFLFGKNEDDKSEDEIDIEDEGDNK